MFTDNSVKLFADSSVIAVSLIHVSCNEDIYPFDKQLCHIHSGEASFTGDGYSHMTNYFAKFVLF